MIPPRHDLSRDSKYMGLAWIYAAFSKDPRTQCGACLLDLNRNYIIGTGYNGPAKNIKDDAFSWDRPSPDDPDGFSKSDVIIHAEINAINRAKEAKGFEIQGSTLFITALPCRECMKDIVDAGVKEIVYTDYRSDSGSIISNKKSIEASKETASLGNVSIRVFDGDINWIRDWVSRMESLGLFAKRS